jgi:hypothetical protein
MATIEDLQVRRERAAKNQSLFREVNERIEDLARGAVLTEFVCECAFPECAGTIRIDVDEYEELRGYPTHFAVIHGHVIEDVERVVAEHDAYTVVEKLGVGASVAAALDPHER